MITSTVRKIRVHDIVNDLRCEINKRKLPGGTPIMSTRELAKHYQVSTLTANRAIMRLVEEGVLYRVKGSGSYVNESTPNQHGRKLSVGLASEMKFRVEPLRNYGEGSLSYFRNHNAEPQIIPYCDLRDPKIMKHKFAQLDGILLAGACHDPETEKILLGFGKPIVMFQKDYIDDCPFDQVTWDYTTAYRDIIGRLGSLENRQFAIFNESHRNGEFRAEKFIEMLLAAGARQENIQRFEADWQPGCEITNYQLGSKAVKHIRGKLLFSSSDILSAMLLNMFDAAGLEAGRDYEFISADNLEGPDFNPFGEPRMTTVHHPRGEAAETAAKLLLDRIKQPTPHRYIIQIATNLVIRKTGLAN